MNGVVMPKFQHRKFKRRITTIETTSSPQQPLSSPKQLMRVHRNNTCDNEYDIDNASTLNSRNIKV